MDETFLFSERLIFQSTRTGLSDEREVYRRHFSTEIFDFIESVALFSGIEWHNFVFFFNIDNFCYYYYYLSFKGEGLFERSSDGTQRVNDDIQVL